MQTDRLIYRLFSEDFLGFDSTFLFSFKSGLTRSFVTTGRGECEPASFFLFIKAEDGHHVELAANGALCRSRLAGASRRQVPPPSLRRSHQKPPGNQEILKLVTKIMELCYYENDQFHSLQSYYQTVKDNEQRVEL